MTTSPSRSSCTWWRRCWSAGSVPCRSRRQPPSRSIKRLYTKCASSAWISCVCIQRLESGFRVPLPPQRQHCHVVCHLAPAHALREVVDQLLRRRAAPHVGGQEHILHRHVGPQVEQAI